MKRRNLCTTKKLLAVIMSASMIMMSTAVPALAQENVAVDTYDDTEEVGNEENVDSAENEQGFKAAVEASSSGEDKEATVKVSNDVTSKTENGSSTGVSAGSNNGSTTTVEVGGDVTSSAENGDAEGVNASASKGYNESSDTKSTTTVTVGGDVAAESTQSSTTGVIAYADGDSEAAVTVKGEVSAKSDSGKSTGIDTRSSLYSSAYADNTSVKVSADNVYSEGATATGIDSGTLGGSNFASKGNTDITVSGDVVAKGEGSGGTAVGVKSGTGAKGDTDITVGGDIRAESSGTATGIESITDGSASGASTSIHAGSIYADGLGTVQGINISNNQEGKTTITVDNDITAAASGESDTLAVGIAGSKLGEGDVSVTVGGDVTAKSILKESSSTDSLYEPQAYAEAIQIEGNQGKLEITVGGNVIQDGTEGWAIGVSDATDLSYFNYNEETGQHEYVESYSANDNSDIDIKVAGDVVASDTAIAITKKSDKSTMDLVVGGTITAEEHSIVVDPDDSTNNLNITVWKVDTSKNNNIVENKSIDETTYKETYTRNEAVEKTINYIIKVESTTVDGASLAVNKEMDSNGFWTGKEAEKVYLKLDIPSGYEVDDFYNGTGAALVNVVKDSSGNYYLEVPRGGGVDIGVKLKAASSNTENNDTPSGGSTAPSGDSTTPSGDSTAPSGDSTTPSGGSDSSVDTPSGGSDSSVKTPSGGSTYYRDDSSSDSSDSDGGSGSTGSSSAPSAPAAPAGFEAKFSDVATALAYQGIDAASFFRVSSVDLMGNALSLDIGSVLTPIDNLTAINNFMDSGAPSLGADNIKGAGVVSFSNVFANSVSDTVSVPVVSDVVSGFTYTVAFSDGTTISVPCAMNGVLEIPFLKTAEGLTYIIYGVSMDPGLAMQQAMQQTT
ncbi:hypothetical protein [Oribacterium sp. NK2B42]|uniref:hypothetical protein n=1 Tax=Oribacterium sp. NK2B42 TaxID=689781 RepID=UPI0003FBDE88|nr:hypothetical protein [Oribacterium sp. NK2B42]